MRKKDFIVPNTFEKELEIRCDSGNKLFIELWTTTMRHMTESATTQWEILGCLDMLKSVFKQRFLSEQSNTEINEENENENNS